MKPPLVFRRSVTAAGKRELFSLVFRKNLCIRVFFPFA